MKIAVSATENHLNAPVDPRFGRAAYFIFVNPETLESEIVPNSNVDGYGGVGVQSAQLIIERGAQAVITGSCGPNAFQVLEAGGIAIYEGEQGTVKEVVEKFNKNQLVPASIPTGQKITRTSRSAQVRGERSLGAKMDVASTRKNDSIPVNQETESISEQEAMILLQKKIDSLEKQLEDVKKQLREFKKESE
ncbi:hypothetical protein B1H10_05170 [candidate division KSB1 bacterium 4484_188]|nr:MAG: hypothetical protein B1H10_05170 [candidate division KSB1 bacterium 4484_188]